jgi:hypothetical protein
MQSITLVVVLVTVNAGFRGPTHRGKLLEDRRDRHIPLREPKGGKLFAWFRIVVGNRNDCNGRTSQTAILISMQSITLVVVLVTVNASFRGRRTGGKLLEDRRNRLIPSQSWRGREAPE